jgi:8-oxo-dGTP pyrophosphatase MutT (NUDIX family)
VDDLCDRGYTLTVVRGVAGMNPGSLPEPNLKIEKNILSIDHGEPSDLESYIKQLLDLPVLTFSSDGEFRPTGSILSMDGCYVLYLGNDSKHNLTEFFYHHKEPLFIIGKGKVPNLGIRNFRYERQEDIKGCFMLKRKEFKSIINHIVPLIRIVPVVVCGFFFYKDEFGHRFVSVKRPRRDKYAYDFPKGRAITGETHVETLEREMREEGFVAPAYTILDLKYEFELDDPDYGGKTRFVILYCEASNKMFKCAKGNELKHCDNIVGDVRTFYKMAFNYFSEKIRLVPFFRITTEEGFRSAIIERAKKKIVSEGELRALFPEKLKKINYNMLNDVVIDLQKKGILVRVDGGFKYMETAIKVKPVKPYEKKMPKKDPEVRVFEAKRNVVSDYKGTRKKKK